MTAQTIKTPGFKHLHEIRAENPKLICTGFDNLAVRELDVAIASGGRVTEMARFMRETTPRAWFKEETNTPVYLNGVTHDGRPFVFLGEANKPDQYWTVR